MNIERGVKVSGKKKKKIITGTEGRMRSKPL